MSSAISDALFTTLGTALIMWVLAWWLIKAERVTGKVLAVFFLLALGYGLIPATISSWKELPKVAQQYQDTARAKDVARLLVADAVKSDTAAASTSQVKSQATVNTRSVYPNWDSSMTIVLILVLALALLVWCLRKSGHFDESLEEQSAGRAHKAKPKKPKPAGPVVTGEGKFTNFDDGTTRWHRDKKWRNKK